MNLKRYKDLLDRGMPFQGHSEIALTDAWLEDVLRRFGENRPWIETNLRSFVERLMAEHKPRLPRERLGMDDSIARQLLSDGLLQIDDRGRAGLGHQTLLDAIHAQTLLRDGATLAKFCSAHYRHPFIRSTLRTLVFLLAERDEKMLRIQVREIMTDDNAAFHLKRLVCETLGELEPNTIGQILLRWMFTDH